MVNPILSLSDTHTHTHINHMAAIQPITRSIEKPSLSSYAHSTYLTFSHFTGYVVKCSNISYVRVADVLNYISSAMMYVLFIVLFQTLYFISKNIEFICYWVSLHIVTGWGFFLTNKNKQWLLFGGIQPSIEPTRFPACWFYT